jgi:hypothetical protein
MPFSALFWPDMPFSTPFLARKCRSILPNILNILHMLNFPARGLKSKYIQNEPTHRGGQWGGREGGGGGGGSSYCQLPRVLGRWDAAGMEPMKHDDAPDAPDRGTAKRYNTDMPHEVPTSSAKGPAQVRTVREACALSMNEAFGRWRSTGPTSGSKSEALIHQARWAKPLQSRYRSARPSTRSTIVRSRQPQY